MYYCMSEKLYPGSLSCLFNARESKKSWRVISGSMLFFDDRRLYGIRKGDSVEEIDLNDGYNSSNYNYDDIEDVDSVPSEILCRENLKRNYYFRWRGEIYFYGGDYFNKSYDGYGGRCERVDL